MTAKRKDLIGGILLIGLGLLVLLSRFINFEVSHLGIFFLPALGALFLLMGILSREAGFMIPGGILSGIGWGSVLTSEAFSIIGLDTGGVFMLVFALGWGLITLLTALFTDETHWWALIPGSIMAVIGLGILFGGIFTTILSVAGKAWPILLIALGVYVLLQAGRAKSLKES